MVDKQELLKWLDMMIKSMNLPPHNHFDMGYADALEYTKEKVKRGYFDTKEEPTC